MMPVPVLVLVFVVLVVLTEETPEKQKEQESSLVFGKLWQRWRLVDSEPTHRPAREEKNRPKKKDAVELAELDAWACSGICPAPYSLWLSIW